MTAARVTDRSGGPRHPRFFRLAVVLTSLAGLLGTATPTQATTIKTLVFVVEAHLNAGLSYPCASPGTLVNPGKCLTGVTTGVLSLPSTGLPTDLLPNLHVNVTGGNTRGYAFRTVAGLCATTGVNILKDGKEPTHGAELCSMSGNGVVTGSCGVNSSNGTADVVVLGQLYTVFFHFTTVGFLVVTGHVHLEGQWGKFYGTAAAVHLPDITGGTTSNSCFQKTAKTFTIPGSGTILIVNHDV